MDLNGLRGVRPAHTHTKKKVPSVWCPTMGRNHTKPSANIHYDLQQHLAQRRRGDSFFFFMSISILTRPEPHCEEMQGSTTQGHFAAINAGNWSGPAAEMSFNFFSNLFLLHQARRGFNIPKQNVLQNIPDSLTIKCWQHKRKNQASLCAGSRWAYLYVVASIPKRPIQSYMYMCRCRHK